MWNLVLALAVGLFVSVLGALVSGLFPRVPNSFKVVALVVLGLVIAIAASETWRRAAFTVVEGNRTGTLLAFMVVLSIIGVIAFLVDQRKALCRELEETRRGLEETRARFGVNAPTTVDYEGAVAIVDQYLSPQFQGMRAGTRIVVRTDFLERFGRVTGAKLGEYKYNRALLHQWMESNAARFLVENRHKMS